MYQECVVTLINLNDTSLIPTLNTKTNNKQVNNKKIFITICYQTRQPSVYTQLLSHLEKDHYPQQILFPLSKQQTIK